MDPNEPSLVVKIGKGLNEELAQQFTEFLTLNQEVLTWAHADMMGIHPEVMCHRLNIDMQMQLVSQKRRELDTDHYKPFRMK